MTRMAPQDRPDAREVAQDLAAILAGASGETLVMPAAEQPRPGRASRRPPSSPVGTCPRSSGVRSSSSSVARCWSASSRPATGPRRAAVLPGGRGRGGRVPHAAARERRAVRRAARLDRPSSLGVVLACAGCGSSPELAADRAQALQESVLAVTQAASEARWADAQSLLAETQTALDDGADAGEVSTARYREIDAALDRGRDRARRSPGRRRPGRRRAGGSRAGRRRAGCRRTGRRGTGGAEHKAPAPAKEPPAPKDKGPGKAASRPPAQGRRSGGSPMRAGGRAAAC